MSRADAPLIAALERSRIHPLWDRYQRITPMAPKAKDAPMHWRWRDIEPFTERADQVGVGACGRGVVHGRASSVPRECSPSAPGARET